MNKSLPGVPPESPPEILRHHPWTELEADLAWTQDFKNHRENHEHRKTINTR